MIKKVEPLGFVWGTEDPFLFCAHHNDSYPEGNDVLGPKVDLTHRNLGQDFDMSNEWKMYHGRIVPGFPEHPHRGFETVTITLEGFVDHHDSMGAAGRYGNGDIQWMTAGSGCQHAEMFPLLKEDEPNPLHLFQVWLNLPKASKFVDPGYRMIWHEDLPQLAISDKGGKATLIHGKLLGTEVNHATKDSWAASPENGVTIAILHLEDQEELTLTPGQAGLSRNLYFYQGDQLAIGDQVIDNNHRIILDDQQVTLKAKGPAKLLLLEGKPIAEPVYTYGPFVMNTEAEIRQAYRDYHENHFGGWPWEKSDPVFPREAQRIAKYADGKVEQPKGAR